ncbi:hypothetical protein HS088_TW04G00991 [Tripterygium wilfordii]|uniref:TLC domain-containing protein n=1 Tax=Tripterygium wilfordii TaxID=458696 RepID=A0A7J7DRN6_TRIWF|nr:hypothetical protein HS088_TW04G00991 [Tripterygium wilfordii]
MARPSNNRNDTTKAGAFFLATLVLWFVSVWFEILFNNRRELLSIVAGIFFYQTANWVIRFFFSRDPLFVSTSVSLLHSTITSASVIFVLLNQYVEIGPNTMFEHSELFGGTWLWAYPALCFSCGYFAYDHLDMLRYQLYNGLIPAILVHHLILLVSFTLALYRNVTINYFVTINYLILTLVCELHSIFVHVRKVRRMAGVRDAKSKIVMSEWVLNWITFLFARLLVHVLITIKLIVDAPKFGKGVVLPLALVGMFGMNLLNAFLGIDLFNAFARERSFQQNNQHSE